MGSLHREYMWSELMKRSRIRIESAAVLGTVKRPASDFDSEIFVRPEDFQQCNGCRQWISIACDQKSRPQYEGQFDFLLGYQECCLPIIHSMCCSKLFITLAVFAYSAGQILGSLCTLSRIACSTIVLLASIQIGACHVLHSLALETTKVALFDTPRSES